MTTSPRPVEALRRAMEQIGAGRFAEALVVLDRLLADAPGQADALHLRAIALSRRGDLAAALASAERAAHAAPDWPEAWAQFAELLRLHGRRARAMAALRRALALRADWIEGWLALSELLRRAGRLRAALRCAERAIDLAPGSAAVARQRAAVRVALEDAGGGEADARAALVLEPDNGQGWLNLSAALHLRQALPEAEAAAARAVSLAPRVAEAHANLATIHHDQGRFPEAIAGFRRAIALAPDDAEAHWNLSWSLLMLGDHAAGFREMEWRLRLPGFKWRPLPGPLWDGSDRPGGTLLVRWEQGHGDSFQFVRFVPLLARRGWQVILECQPLLFRILRGLPGVAALAPAGGVVHLWDAQVPLMSLAHHLRITQADLPGRIPYLSADAEARRRWAMHLPPSGRLRVGLVWQGNPRARADLGRSPPLRAYAPLASVPGIDFISLQKEHGLEQLRDLPNDFRVAALPETLDDFADTAAVLEQLDLVITSDTAVAHLAGALGRPAWVALKHVPDWRWGATGFTTPWYPTLRLFRQAVPGDWDGVFEAMAGALAGWAAGARGQSGSQASGSAPG